MRMSKKAMAALASALIYHAWARDEENKGNWDEAKLWGRERDVRLAEAGLPNKAALDDAYNAVHFPGKPARAARAARPRPLMSSMVQSVRGFALDHYNRDGWDYLVECWSDADIEEAIGNARTIAGAIAACRKTVRLLNERRTEVENTVW